MATKKKAPKKGKDKPKKTKPVGGTRKKGAGGGKPRSQQPRQQALIEDARIKPLDDCAASIADVRDNMNELRGEEKGYLSTARSLMHKYGKSVYKHAGVEIVLVPGDEKVRVRILKDDGNASSSGSDDAGGDAGAGEGVAGDRTGSDESAGGE